jgi:hypothetical protein
VQSKILSLYDTIQQDLDTEVAQNCQGANCDNPIYRNDSNYFDCFVYNDQMFLLVYRSLEYKCRPTLNPAVPPLLDTLKALFFWDEC